jgi:hypothetical protein
LSENVLRQNSEERSILLRIDVDCAAAEIDGRSHNSHPIEHGDTCRRNLVSFSCRIPHAVVQRRNVCANLSPRITEESDIVGAFPWVLHPEPING